MILANLIFLATILSIFHLDLGEEYVQGFH